MSSLEEIRKDIEKIDEDIIKLFEERFSLVEKVIGYKIKNNMEINDSNREKYLIDKNISKIKNPNLKEYYIDFLKNLFILSKKYQKDILEREGK